MCGMCESTFYHRLREYRATLNTKNKNHCKKVHLNTNARTEVLLYLTKAFYCDIIEKEVENKPKFGLFSTFRVQKNHCKKVYFYTKENESISFIGVIWYAIIINSVK